MRVVILAGGQGLRMNEMGRIPKALVKIGDKTLVEHVMSIYASQGHTDFILAVGHLGHKVEKWVETADLPWNIQAVQTGEMTKTGGRIATLVNRGLLKDEAFFLTYADGLANIDLNGLIEAQQRAQTLVVLTAVKPRSQFGILKISDASEEVTEFVEKPFTEDWVNGGFFLVHRNALGFFNLDSDLEKEILPELAGVRELAAYKHKGFWKQVDNPKDLEEANDLWEKEKPWVF